MTSQFVPGATDLSFELVLLLLCARVNPTALEASAIRSALGEGIDWTGFARQALDHGLAGLAGHTLGRVAPDLVPDDILDALGVIVEQSRRSNRALFEELAQLMGALAGRGIRAIPFKGPVLALQAYGDLGLRVFRDLDFLIGDADLCGTMALLGEFGYERQGDLTASQFELIHRLQGQEIVFRKSGGTAIEPHTRLTSIKMALDIDYEGLWRRAGPVQLDGHTVLTFAPEDDFLILAIHGGKEMWWNIKWAADAAAFIASHPNLDWTAIAARARAQGCLRMVLLASALAERYFGAAIPGQIVALQDADRAVGPMMGRILAHWQGGQPLGPPSNRTLSLDRMRLHDGVLRRADYVARTLLLPGPHHVARIALGKRFTNLFAYIPIKFAHDLIAGPAWHAYRQIRARARRVRDSLANSHHALALTPTSANAKRDMERHQKARADAKRALDVDPNDAGAWFRLGQALSGLKNYTEAIACYDRALTIVPDSMGFWKARGAAIRAINKTADLTEIVEEPAPGTLDANAWARWAGFLSASQRFGEAAAASDHALAINPNHLVALRIGIRCRIVTCDWSKRDDDKRRISESLRAGLNVITPFNHRTICDSEAESLVLAQLVGRGFPRSEPLWRGEKFDHGRIRIAYISGEFFEHPMTSVMAGLYEHHDKTRFETIAISLGPDDGSQMRRRIETSMDRFMDVQHMSDAEIAAMIRQLEVDIAVDLNGFAGSGRPGILARRPAPVQVNYLAYSGTTGLPFIDYIIADHVVIPDENRIHYTERVVDLPHTYMPNDRTRRIGAVTPSRSEAGLPDTGFVFACHNAEHKISPEIFDVWMRLLRLVEASVLWLKLPEPTAMVNLRREAKARGVAPERLIFAPRLVQAQDHLARLRLADLFLDTLPYNAHATACDALWAGLPVLTCLGNTFAGRVGASLLFAIGLPELVTSSLQEYEEMALTLARNPERLAAIKARLMRNRDTEPLFDTLRYTRDLEYAYRMMQDRLQAGLPPASFAVEAAS